MPPEASLGVAHTHSPSFHPSLVKASGEIRTEQSPKSTSSSISISDTILRIRAHSSVFKDIPDVVIRQLLRKVHQYEPGTILTKEGTRNTPSFYILLRGRIQVSLLGKKITDFSGLQIFGEGGFAGGPRVATTTVEETAYAIEVTQADIETFSDKIQMYFFRNLLRESAEKLDTANRRKIKVLSEGTGETEAEVRKQVLDIV